MGWYLVEQHTHNDTCPSQSNTNDHDKIVISSPHVDKILQFEIGPLRIMKSTTAATTVVWFLLVALTTTYPTSAWIPNVMVATRPVVTSSTSNTIILGALGDDDGTVSQISSSSRERPQREKRRVSILLCPAQFCVPADYEVLWDELKIQQQLSSTITIGTTAVAPLSRTSWIQVAKAVPTPAFFSSQLPVHSTLDWYFQAIEQGLAEIYAKEGPTANICIIGHSIGGWVARAYLGGCSRSSTAIFRMTRQQCSSLITLGTPHLVSPFALVDQTRGLISEIEQTPSCSPRALQEEHGIDITCVCSSGVNGNFWDGFRTETSSTAPLETLIAAASYLPLVGTMNTRGDGIVPLPVAFLEDTRHVILEQCSVSNKFIIHSHVLPTPWNLWNGTAPSISLLSSSNDDDSYVSYVSPGVVSQWAPYIR